MRHWVRMPSGWIKDGRIRRFKYSSSNQGMNAANIAALMIFLVILSRAKENEINNRLIAYCTYEEFMATLGISRQSISMGLKVLKSNDIISIEKIGRANQYTVNRDKDEKWCKVPILNIEAILLGSFSLRSKIELYALKLFFYFAAIRSNEKEYSIVSYDTITSVLGIPRAFIKRTLSFMLVSELLSKIDRGIDELTEVSKFNLYYLSDYQNLVFRRRWIK